MDNAYGDRPLHPSDTPKTGSAAVKEAPSVAADPQKLGFAFHFPGTRPKLMTWRNGKRALTRGAAQNRRDRGGAVLTIRMPVPETVEIREPVAAHG